MFCGLEAERQSELLPYCLCVFREREGMSAILQQEAAERAQLAFDGSFCQITLQVHSSLEAVGLTAAVAGELAEAGISANVVAALRHDHIFVAQEDAERALRLLRGLSNRAQYS